MPRSAAQNEVQDTASAYIFLKEATFLNAGGQYKQALEPAQKAYDLYRISGGDDHHTTAAAAYQLGFALTRQSKAAAAVPLLQSAVATWSAQFPDGALLTADAWYELGLAYEKSDHLQDALDAHRRALQLREQLLPEMHSAMAASFYQIGNMIYELGPQTDAFPWFEKAIAVNTVVFGAESKQVATGLNQLGRAYLYIDDFENGVKNAEKALAIQLKILPPVSFDISSTYYTLGMCSKNLRRFDDALACFEKSLAIKKQLFPGNLSVLPGSYSEMGKTWLEKKDFQRALGYFEINDSIFIQIQGDTQWTYAYPCTDMARVHYALKNFAAAEKWFEKSIYWMRKHYQRETVDIGVLLTMLGNTQTALGKMEAAHTTITAAGQIFLDNLGPDNASQYQAESALAWWYQKMYVRTGDRSYLLDSRRLFADAQKSIDRLIRFEKSPAVRKMWLSETKQIFEQAIATEALFYQKENDPDAVENAWQLSETMHGFELFAASQEVDARQFSGIPAELLLQEKTVRARLTTLQHERRALVEDQQLAITDSLVVHNNNLYFAQKEVYNRLISNLEQQYPEYHRLKYHFRNTTIAQTREMLGPNQTLVEYFTGDSVIYVLVVQPGFQDLRTIPRHFPLDQWVAQFRESISAAQNQAADYEQSIRQYVFTGQQLYQHLIAPVHAGWTDEILIIADGALLYLPFDALLPDTPKDLSNFKTYPFWIREKSVGYAPSATMLYQMVHKKHRQETTCDLLGFAPFFFGDTAQLAARIDRDLAVRKGFQPLPYTGEEILRAQKRTGGQSVIFNGNTATLDQFRSLAPGFSILHLATHGKANARTGEFSYLAFSGPADSLNGGRLYVNDLYNMTINADLVVLSACETGIGELFEGEGMVSLARAFAFAGAKSVVTSLWNVNDRSSLLLMDYFYRELHTGKTKHTALSDAKRSYLKAYPGAGSHPFYWAGFVGISDWSRLK